MCPQGLRGLAAQSAGAKPLQVSGLYPRHPRFSFTLSYPCRIISSMRRLRRSGRSGPAQHLPTSRACRATSSAADRGGRGADQRTGRAAVKWRLAAGLSHHRAPRDAPAPVAEALPLAGVYEDKNLLVVNQALGRNIRIPNTSGTLLNALLAHAAGRTGLALVGSSTKAPPAWCSCSGRRACRCNRRCRTARSKVTWP